jgi:hypothetical protein
MNALTDRYRSIKESNLMNKENSKLIKIVSAFIKINLFLSILNFIMPINWIVQLFFFTGLSIYIFKIRRFPSVTRIKNNLLFKSLLTLTLVYLFMCTLSFPSNHDSINYHYPIINILKNYSVIFGLGNIQGHYALDSQVFKLSALLDFPFFILGSQLANFLLLAMYLYIYGSCLLNRDTTFLQRNYLVISTTIIMIHAVTNASFWLASPSPDLASLIIAFIAFFFILSGIESVQKNEYIYIGLQILFIATLFRSYVLPLAFTILIYFILFNKNLSEYLKIKIIFFAILVTLIQIIEKIVKTGFPLYPNRILSLDVPWRMKDNIVIDVELGIRYWQQRNFSSAENTINQFSLNFLTKSVLTDFSFSFFIIVMTITFSTLIFCIFRYSFKEIYALISQQRLILFLIISFNWLLIYSYSPQMRFFWIFSYLLVIIILVIILDILNVKIQNSNPRYKAKLKSNIQYLPFLFVIGYILFFNYFILLFTYNSMSKTFVNPIYVKFLSHNDLKPKLSNPIQKRNSLGQFNYSYASKGCGYSPQFCTNIEIKNVQVSKVFGHYVFTNKN